MKVRIIFTRMSMLINDGYNQNEVLIVPKKGKIEVFLSVSSIFLIEF